MPDDLTRLGDTPLSNHPTLDDDAAAFVEQITDLLDEAAYQFAADTLVGIRTTVERIGRVTDRQRLAVTNIVASVRTREPRRSRRYEGWEPR